MEAESMSADARPILERRRTTFLLAAAVLTLGNACVFFAREVRTEVVVGQSQDAEKIAGPAGKPVLTLSATDRTIVVVTARERTCTRVTYDVLDVTVTKRLGLKIAPPEFFDAMEAMAKTGYLAPVALVGYAGAIAVGVVTLPIGVGDVLVSNHSPARRQERRAARTVSSPCPLPIAAHVRIDTPTGLALRVNTDATGRGTIELPATEPATGVLRGTLGTQHAHVTYFQDRASCVATRDAYLASISNAPREQRRDMVPRLPACGKLTSGGPADAPREEAWELTARALADALAGRCKNVLAADAAILDLDGAHHADVFEMQPDIATCLAKGLVREQIDTGVATMRERLERCAPLLPGGGTVRMKLAIDHQGKVTSATVAGGGSELAACVQLVLERSTFPATELGGEARILLELPAWPP